MRLAVHDAAAKSAAGLHIHSAGASKAAERAWIRTGGVTTQFYSSLASGGADPGVSVHPTFADGTVSSSSSRTVTSREVSVTVGGGVGPYTYAWSSVSGDPMTATDPSSDTTAFTASVSPGAVLAAEWKCTVTDAAGKTADSPNVNVGLNNIGGTL